MAVETTALPFGCELGCGDDSLGNKSQRRSGRLVFFGGSGTGLVIFGVLVHLPEIVKLGISENIFDAQHRGHHGVILIVVLVHAVAANEMEARITDIKFFTKPTPPSSTSPSRVRPILISSRLASSISSSSFESQSPSCSKQKYSSP